jgi:hypothetical protein
MDTEQFIRIEHEAVRSSSTVDGPVAGPPAQSARVASGDDPRRAIGSWDTPTAVRDPRSPGCMSDDSQPDQQSGR